MTPVTLTDEEIRAIADGDEAPEYVAPSVALRHGAGTITVEDVDGDGQVRVTTPAIEAGARRAEVQLPLFEGHRFSSAVISFAGSLDFPIDTDDDRALMEALRLGRKVIVRLALGEDEDARVVALDAEVTVRSFAFKGADGIPTTTSKVQVNGRRFDED